MKVARLRRVATCSDHRPTRLPELGGRRAYTTPCRSHSPIDGLEHVTCVLILRGTLDAVRRPYYISLHGELLEMEERVMRDVVTIAKALSDANRVRILAI